MVRTEPRAANGQPKGPLGPMNPATVRAHAGVVLEKASALLGYQSYLTQVGRWKARRKPSPPGLEQEARTQARQALADARALAVSAVFAAKHVQQAGGLDLAFDHCAARVKASGVLQVADLWSVTAKDPNARQAIRGIGVSDELWTSIDANMRKLTGRIGLGSDTLVADLALGREAIPPVTFKRSASGTPRSVDELLGRDRFDRIAELLGSAAAFPFERTALISATSVGTPAIEIQDAVLAGAIRSVQHVASHKRRLDDVGLSSYTGQDPLTVLVIVGCVLFDVGLLFELAGCGRLGNNSALCEVGLVLTILGAIALGGAAGGIADLSLLGSVLVGDLAGLLLTPVIVVAGEPGQNQ
jgi:hypothetical protein